MCTSGITKGEQGRREEGSGESLELGGAGAGAGPAQGREAKHFEGVWITGLGAFKGTRGWPQKDTVTCLVTFWEERWRWKSS